MSRVTIDDGILTDVAESIRNKNGTTESISPIDFATLIDGISAGQGDSDNSVEVLEVILTNAAESVTLPTSKAMADISWITVIPVDALVFVGSANRYVAAGVYFPNGNTQISSKTYYSLTVNNNWGNISALRSTENICSESDEGVIITGEFASGKYRFIIGGDGDV